MTDLEITNQALEAAERVRQLRIHERVVTAILVAFLVGGSIFAMIAIAHQNEIRKLVDRQACVARITADFQGAVAAALSAPPAPNPARKQATDEITAASDKLTHLERVCPA